MYLYGYSRAQLRLCRQSSRKLGAMPLWYDLVASAETMQGLRMCTFVRFGTSFHETNKRNDINLLTVGLFCNLFQTPKSGAARSVLVLLLESFFRAEILSGIKH
jgi:hypothetical protein